IANQPWMLIVLGLVMAVVYYFVFTFMIKTFNLMTPGREEGEAVELDDDDAAVSGDSKFAKKAAIIFEGLGGWDNIVSVDNCATRLRLDVKDSNAIDEAKIKSAGVAGVRKVGDKAVQVIVGTEVQFVADEINKIPKTK